MMSFIDGLYPPSGKQKNRQTDGDSQNHIVTFSEGSPLSRIGTRFAGFSGLPVFLVLLLILVIRFSVCGLTLSVKFSLPSCRTQRYM